MLSKHEEYLPAILELLTKTNDNHQLKLPTFSNLTNKFCLESKDYAAYLSFYFNISILG